MSILGFGDQLKQFAKIADERANLVVRKIVFDISTGLVLKTPVGDAKYWVSPAPPGYVGGRARGNWQFGLDAPNLYMTGEYGPFDQAGTGTINKIVGEVPVNALGHTHFITNTLPYIKPLEDGWSKRQAPNGMVNLTRLEFDPIVRAAVAELTK